MSAHVATARVFGAEFGARTHEVFHPAIETSGTAVRTSLVGAAGAEGLWRCGWSSLAT